MENEKDFEYTPAMDIADSVVFFVILALLCVVVFM